MVYRPHATLIGDFFGWGVGEALKTSRIFGMGTKNVPLNFSPSVGGGGWRVPKFCHQGKGGANTLKLAIRGGELPKTQIYGNF